MRNITYLRTGISVGATNVGSSLGTDEGGPVMLSTYTNTVQQLYRAPGVHTGIIVFKA